MSITHSLTMAVIKPEDGDNSIWQGYSLQAPSPVTSQSHSPTYKKIYQSESPILPHHGGRHKSQYRSLDIPPVQTKLPVQAGPGVISISPLSSHTHNSYPSLERASHCSKGSPYGEVVQDMEEEITDLPKSSISQDHRLLSFGRVPDKHIILDANGRRHHIDLAAQIHGMFFLSEMSDARSAGLPVQPELTCYRRNLFQISGTVTTRQGPLSVITERGERFYIMSLEVVVSASESVDGHAVKLIVIPWKTPPPNSPEVGHGLEHEPATIPLLPNDEESLEANNETSVYSIAFRRMQFRVATANNGRRRELQQHFTLHLNVVAILLNETRINLCETITAPIVVRGRSPRNFQARKEVSLVSASSSRGGLPDLHVTTSTAPGVTPVSAPAGRSKGPKPESLEFSCFPFTFDSNHPLPLSPSLLHSS